MTEHASADLESLFRHAGWLRRLVAGLVGDDLVGGDLAQAVLHEGVKAGLAGDREPRSWLAHVLRKRALDHRRAEGRRRAREATAAALASEPPVSPEALVGDVQLHRLLAQTVFALEEPFRQTIVLRYYEGLSAADVARKLRVPAGTVRWRAKEGLSRLRRALDEHSKGDRSEWMRALVPLLPTGARESCAAPAVGGMSPLVLVAASMSVLAVLVAVGNAWWIRTGWRLAYDLREAADPARAAEPAANLSLGRGEQWGHRAPAACLEWVTRVHGEIVALEADLFDWDKEFRFELGGPNPEAESAMRAFADAFVAERGELALEHRFRCRTWACRLAIRKPRPGSHGFGGDVPTPEGVLSMSGDGLEEAEGLPAREGTFVELIQIALRQPSGQSLGNESRRPAPRSPPALPADATTAECFAVARRLEDERTVLRARWRKAEPLEHNFVLQSEVNHQLEAELTRALPWWSRWLASTECRGDVCRRAALIPALVPLRHLDDDSYLLPVLRRHRASSTTSTHGPDYHNLSPPP